MLMFLREINVPIDGKKLLALLQLVELLVIRLGVLLLNFQLTKFLTVEYAEW